MNAISLNNLWFYLQGLTLTPSNKRWLAAHLTETAKVDAVDKRIPKKWPKLSKKELVISPEVMSLVQDIDPLPEDYDVEQARLEYLIKKYG